MGFQLFLIIPEPILKKEKRVPLEKDKPVVYNDKNEEAFQKIIGVLENQHLYRTEGLKLSSLSAITGIPENTLSKVINDKTGNNFQQLINYYRVEEAKKLLLGPENEIYTVESIGYQVGFQSKAAFYASFKMYVSMSPATYRNRFKHNNV